MDTVLVGGFVFLLAGGTIFLAIDKVGKSDMAERSRRLITCALMGGLTVLTITIFHWHRTVWLAGQVPVDRFCITIATLTRTYEHNQWWS